MSDRASSTPSPPSPSTRPLTPAEERHRDEFAERLLASTIGMMDLFSVHLGDRLGLYHVLAQGSATPPELAARSGCNERYMREWLEQQAATGILEVDDAAAPAAQRRFSLPRGYAEVLLDRDSLNFAGPIVRLAVGATSPLPALIEAYRTGGGVPFADYGIDVREGQSEVNRPPFLYQLGGEWLPAVPAVHQRLQSDPPARVADVGCGAAWSAIGIARAYPKVRVDGLDLDEASVELAKQNVAEAGLSDRVEIHLRDAADASLSGQFDLATICEALHDMSRPVEALRATRGLLAPGGSALVIDERVEEQFTAPAGDIERMMYGWSILHCLPAGMAEQPSAATGTVMRPDTVREYAREAGFARVDVLSIEHPFFRFYYLIP